MGLDMMDEKGGIKQNTPSLPVEMCMPDAMQWTIFYLETSEDSAAQLLFVILFQLSSHHQSEKNFLMLIPLQLLTVTFPLRLSTVTFPLHTSISL